LAKAERPVFKQMIQNDRFPFSTEDFQGWSNEATFWQWQFGLHFLQLSSAEESESRADSNKHYTGNALAPLLELRLPPEKIAQITRRNGDQTIADKSKERKNSS
jgi:hypothetical protein